MKQIQRQQLQQKFSPQQIQLMRLLQLPVTDLEKAIKEEQDIHSTQVAREDISTRMLNKDTDQGEELQAKFHFVDWMGAVHLRLRFNADTVAITAQENYQNRPVKIIGIADPLPETPANR